MYMDDLSGIQEDVAAWMQARFAARGAFPDGTRGIEPVRGITAGKFVRVLVDVHTRLDDYERRFFEWLPGVVKRHGLPAAWLDKNLYTFAAHGKWTEPT